jgi:hypothetical protein
MIYNLFLDDFRFPIDAFYYTRNPMYNKLEWIIVRDYDSFVNYIIKNGLPNIVSFDHDLADIHYSVPVNGIINYSDYKEKTGYHCAEWLVYYCIDNKLKFPEYHIHSMNSIGKKNIISCIETAKRIHNFLYIR